MNINLKQLEVTEFQLDDHTFYVKPFPAMKSASISTDVAKVIGPVIGGLFTAIRPGANTNSAENLLSAIDPQKAVSVLGTAFSSLDGEEMERIIRRLLLDYGNVSLSGPYTENRVKPLDMDAINEVFCYNAQDIFVLCWDVINLNFKGFFGKLRLQFGNLSDNTEEETTAESSVMAPLT